MFKNVKQLLEQKKVKTSLVLFKKQSMLCDVKFRNLELDEEDRQDFCKIVKNTN